MQWSTKWFEGYRGSLREGVPLARYSNLRIGGPAALFLEPWSEEDAALAVRVCLEHDLPWEVLGAGSNVLIPDEGVQCVVFHVGHWNRVVRDGDRLIASAGRSLPSLLRQARELGLGGLEFLAGIPAQVGGAVAMNAGTRECETCDLVESVRIVDRYGELREVGRDGMHPTYRDGGLGHCLVTTATFRLTPRPEAVIRETYERLMKHRNQTQPVSERSVGCIFKNPEGDFAARLIQEAGLKGERLGDLEVSTKHANYFVNHGEGTAAQLMELMRRVQARVHDRFGVRLQPGPAVQPRGGRPGGGGRAGHRAVLRPKSFAPAGFRDQSRRARASEKVMPRLLAAFSSTSHWV
ncbi:MAG: UDP-N-acetylmuramate dehydrogenase [Planctomycetota bacterium]